MLDEKEKLDLIENLDNNITTLTNNFNYDLETEENSSSSELFNRFKNSFKKQKTLTQVQDYLEENFPKEDLKICPISFWNRYKNRFPQLTLIPPATSCKIEEIFSQCGIVLSSRRANLLPEKANKSLFIKINTDL